MSEIYNGPIQDTIDALARLPGIGPKGAQRIAFYLLTARKSEVEELSRSIATLQEKVHFCDICGNITEHSPCIICTDPRRDATTICVVEEPKDVMVIERTGEFHGLYHVLGGAINPMADIGPADLRIRELLERLKTPLARENPEPSIYALESQSRDEAESTATATTDSGAATKEEGGEISHSGQFLPREAVQEVILALNPDIEGEATTTYLSRLLEPTGIRVTRLASGLPVGSDLDYADEITLRRALIGRRDA